MTPEKKLNIQKWITHKTAFNYVELCNLGAGGLEKEHEEDAVYE